MKKLCAAALAAATALVTPTTAIASSHREAPFITRSPKVDGTDLYVFNSYESGRTGFVTLIANYQPLQDAYGGPNYFSMDPDALYEIHIDNTGDGVEDITYQFRFQNSLLNGDGFKLSVGPDAGFKNVGIPLVQQGPIVANPDGGFPDNLNFREAYTATVVTGPRRAATATPQSITKVGGGSSFVKPTDYIGTKTFANYGAYANAHIYPVTIPGCTTAGSKMFVGQRADRFAVNLGTIFDLINAPGGLITTAGDTSDGGYGNRNLLPTTIAGKNVTTIALEIPASCLVSGSTPVIGVWTTASLRQARVLNPTAKFTVPSKEGGAWVQVSRLGNPLVNEVVIGINDKDKFNGSEPKDDVANFADYVFNPTLPELIEILFGAPGTLAPNQFPRTDLVGAFLTGIAPVNAFPAGAVPADTLKLNTTVSTIFTPRPAAAQNNLGAAGCISDNPDAGAPVLNPAAPTCDATGYPNGRRPGDDVVDIALRVSMGYLLAPGVAPARAVPFHDAVLQDASQFNSAFPYLPAPSGGTP